MKGFYLPGIFIIFEVVDYLKLVNTIVGTSIGGVVGSIYCLGYSGDEMVNLFMTTDFGEMISEMRPGNFLTHGWFGDGEWFETYLSKCIKNKTGNDDITLRNLYELCGKKLVMNTVLKPLKDRKIENMTMIMDYESHPDLSLIKAIRMTTCLPGLLKPIIYDLNGILYECYDGGALDNYMIHKYEPKDVLGIYLGTRSLENEKDNILAGVIFNYNLIIL